MDNSHINYLNLMSILYARAMDDTNLYMKYVTRLKLEGGWEREEKGQIEKRGRQIVSCNCSNISNTRESFSGDVKKREKLTEAAKAAKKKSISVTGERDSDRETQLDISDRGNDNCRYSQ